MTDLAYKPLGPREAQILALIAEGHTDPEISALLFIGVSTIKTWKGRLYEKLGARNAANAVHLAYQAGLLAPAGAEMKTAIEDLAVVRHAREMGYRLALVPDAGGAA